jgi:hypothetical protein
LPPLDRGILAVIAGEAIQAAPPRVIAEIASALIRDLALDAQDAGSPFGLPA